MASSTCSTITRGSVLADAEAAAAAGPGTKPVGASFRAAVQLDAAHAEEHAAERELLRERLYALFAEDVDDMRRNMVQLQTRIDASTPAAESSGVSVSSRCHAAATTAEDAGWPPVFPAAGQRQAGGVTMRRGAPPDVVDSVSSAGSAPSNMHGDASTKPHQERRKSPAAQQQKRPAGSPTRAASTPRTTPPAAPSAVAPPRSMRPVSAAAKRRVANILRQLEASHDQQVQRTARHGALLQELAVALEGLPTQDASRVKDEDRAAPGVAKRSAAAVRKQPPTPSTQTVGRPPTGGPVIVTTLRDSTRTAVPQSKPSTRRIPSFVSKARVTSKRPVAPHQRACSPPKQEAHRAARPHEVQVRGRERCVSSGESQTARGSVSRSLSHHHPATFFPESRSRSSGRIVPVSSNVAAGAPWARAQ